jgi:Ca2+-binding RTX toxin-like protein
MPGLAAGASLTDGRLRINGSTGDDVITVSTNARHSGLIDVSINGAVTQFDGTLVRRIEVFAGPGDDRVEVSDTPSASAELYGHSGDDQLVISDPDIQAMVNGGAGDDRISGSPGATSKLYGEAGNDTLTGGDRSDSLIGGSGDDSLAGGNAVNDGLNVLHGGAGDDTLVGGRGLDLAYGGGGNDLILTAAGNDTVNGGDGNDDIDAGGNDDVVNGGAGDDFIRGGEGNDYLYGDAGDDTVWGQSGDDVLGGDTGFTGALVAQPTPAPGDDSLDGGTGNDYLVGSRESLTFADDNGRDTMTGGPGGDVINARGDDVVTDAGADDVVPAARDAGGGPYAVEQTATLTISMPPAFGTASVATPLPGGTGEFAGSTFYADADGTLHMRDVVAREFTLGEFFRNWGVPVTFAKRGRFGAFARASITVNGVENPALDRWVVRAGDVVNVVVAV